MQKLTRCHWAYANPLMMKYHDQEWGVPIYDDEKLFEFLILEGAQAGLSWNTILQRRENYRLCFDNFSPDKIALYNETKIKNLMLDSRIIRNKLKINAAITNAQIYLDMKKKGINFSEFLWRFVNEKPIKNSPQNAAKIPVSNAISDKMAKELKKLGFKFVGSTICYAFMQAVGMINDHVIDCYRYREIK